MASHTHNFLIFVFTFYFSSFLAPTRSFYFHYSFHVCYPACIVYQHLPCLFVAFNFLASFRYIFHILPFSSAYFASPAILLCQVFVRQCLFPTLNLAINFLSFILGFLLCMMDLRAILCICSTPYNLAPVSPSPFTFIFPATIYNCCYLSISLYRYAFIQADHPLSFSTCFSRFVLFFFHFLYTFHFQLLT